MAAPVRRQQPSRKVKMLPRAVAHDSGRNTETKDSAPSPPSAASDKPTSHDRNLKIGSGPSSWRSKPPLSLRDRKLLSYKKYQHESPFPSFPRPTRADVKTALSILTSLHGPRLRPATSEMVAPANRSGCGDSPSVLDALVRTILSQNTSDANSSRAKRSMDSVYGRSDDWDAIVAGGQQKLEDAIRCGGLGVVKSRVILRVLEQVKERHGSYSLEALRRLGNDEVMGELLSFDGVGPKTASCVMLFSLGRESFAVDTHVWRIVGLLGWRPRRASRDETHLHLDVRVPDEDKYALHRLMVAHGKVCRECKANGAARGICPLRNAFRRESVEEKQEAEVDSI